jgi:uncharacterized protein YqjF (DUF2071 family)
MPHLPKGTDLDSFGGRHFVSLVGFLFLDTHVLGLPALFHQNFEEVNLRFYVRRITGGEVRHGVTFIKEIVPLPAVAATARLTFNEPYETREMQHKIDKPSETSPTTVEYSWKESPGWGKLGITTTESSHYPEPGSLEEFLAIRHWGYTRQRDGGTTEYRVEHADWLIWPELSHVLTGNCVELYGEKFASVLEHEPDSVFLADGSAVSVSAPHRLR